MIKIILLWIGIPLVLAFVIFIVYVLMRVAKSGTSGKTNNFWSQIQKGVKWLWEKTKHPAFFIVIGIAIINWLIWALDAEFWVSIWNSQAKFWAINVASLAAVYLLFVKDESTKKTNPVALTFSKIIGGIVGLILVTCIWDFMAKGVDVRFPFFGTSRSTSSNNTAPEEVILEEIARCESGGKQFTDNVVTRNMNGTPEDQSDDDIGKWQINLKHQAAIIKELEANVFEEKDNHRVAKEVLKRQGTDPWNATRHCWEKGLVARGYNPKKNYLPSSRKEEVASKDGEWSPVVNNDRRFEKVRWYPNQKEGCEIRADEDDRKVFGCGDMLNLDVVPKTFSFRHKEKEPMTVEVRFTDPFQN